MGFSKASSAFWTETVLTEPNSLDQKRPCPFHGGVASV